MPQIAQETQGSPVLAFVDPFGISPLKYDQFRSLLHRRWPLDLILTFQHRALHRLAKDHPHLITDAIGTGGWKTIWDGATDPQSQTEQVLQLFRANLLNDGRFLDVFFYPIRPSIRASPRYYLLFGSRHYDAFELWNDEIVSEEAILSTRQYEILARQSTFLPAYDEEVKALNLLREIRELGSINPVTTRQHIVMRLVRDRWGQYHTGEIKRAVNSLIGSGEISREHGSGRNINTDRLNFSQHPTSRRPA